MAGSVILTSLSQLQEQRKGFIQISITNFDLSDTTAPAIALGSRLEHGGTVIQFTANESISGFAGLGAGVCYAYIDGSAYTATWTATAPVWDTEKQGYYSVDGTKRYFLRCVKDAGGNYTQKALYTNVRQVLQTYIGLALNPLANGDQEIRFATDASILWDESEDSFNINKPLLNTVLTNAILNSYAKNTGTLLKTITSDAGSKTIDFDIKKPISAYFVGSSTGASGDVLLQQYQNGSYRTYVNTGTGTTYGIVLMPGAWRIYVPALFFTGTLYCTSVYGDSAVTVTDIVT